MRRLMPRRDETETLECLPRPRRSKKRLETISRQRLRDRDSNPGFQHVATANRYQIN